MTKKLKTYALIIWAAGAAMIFFGSVSEHVRVPEEYHLDKFIHGGAYAGLAFLSYFFIGSQKLQNTALLLLVAMGGAVEIIQTYVPTRDGTVGDFAADTVGVIVGAWIAKKLKVRFIAWLYKQGQKK